MRLLLTLAVFCCCGYAEVSGQNETMPRPSAKKIIECGWDNPTVQFFHDNIREIEKIPYDGTRLKLERTAEGKVHGWQTVSGADQWQYAWFAEDLKLLKETKSEIYTHNFLLLGFPVFVPWNNDERWKTFCRNVAIMAKLAKEGGLKGFVLDTECYTSPLQFKYCGTEGSYEQARRTARERGRQFMKAIASEYPDMTLFTFLLFSMNSRFIDSNDPEETLKNSDYALKIPFLNGMLDELPPQMKIVEGNESAGYTSACREDLLQGYFNAIRTIRNSTYAENQSKLNQVRVAAAIYLDAYFVWRDERKEPYALFSKLPPAGKLDAFRRMLGYTMEITDEYAWSWGECGEWWPMPLKKAAMDRILLNYRRDPLWVNSVLGILEAFMNARKPMESAIQLVRMQNLPNLVANPSFEKADKEGKPSNWGCWARGKGALLKAVKAPGAGKDDDSAAVISGASIATFSQAFRVKPEEQFLVTGYFKTEGDASTSIEIGWGCNGRQRVELERIIVQPVRSENGWVFCRSLITVPPGRDLIFIHLFANNAEKGNVSFDRIELYRIDYLPHYQKMLEKANGKKTGNTPQ